MTTDDNLNEKKYSIDDYAKDALLKKHTNKPNRMIRMVLDDGTVLIGKNRYDALKMIPTGSLTPFQKEQVDKFEEFHGIKDYIKNAEEVKKATESKLDELEKRKNNAIKNINVNSVWAVFKNSYLAVNGVEFLETEETLKNIKPLIYYFAKDERFLKYGVKVNGNFLSKPNLDKGVCIIGGFGNGKTSVMNTFQKMFIGLEGYAFGRFSSHELVRMFEDASKYNHPEMVENFWKLITKSELYIDDVKAEPDTFAFGKRNLLNSIFQERYNKKLKTHISINYAVGKNEKPLEALLEFKAKYSNQVYDRIYEMYNIIEFKGRSFRI